MAEPGANTVYPNIPLYRSPTIMGIAKISEPSGGCSLNNCSIAFNLSLTDILLHSVKLTVAAAQKQSNGLLGTQYKRFRIFERLLWHRALLDPRVIELRNSFFSIETVPQFHSA